MLPLDPLDTVALEASLAPYIRIYLENGGVAAARLLASEASSHREIRVAGESLTMVTAGEVPGGEEDAVRAVRPLVEGRLRVEHTGYYTTVYYGGVPVATLDGSTGPDVLGRLMLLGGSRLVCAVIGDTCEPVGDDAVRVKGVGLVELEGARLSANKRLSELGWRPRRRARTRRPIPLVLGRVESVTVSLAGTIHNDLDVPEDVDERLATRIAAKIASDKGDPVAALYLYIYASVDEQSRLVRRLLSHLVPPRVRAILDPTSLVADYGVWWRAVDGTIVESGPASTVKVVCSDSKCTYANATTPAAVKALRSIDAPETSIRTLFGTLVAGSTRIPGLDESVYMVMDETVIVRRAGERITVAEP